MCYSQADGGLRCGAEAKKALDRTRTKYNAVKDAKTIDVPAYTKARSDYEKALTDWYTTTEGIKELKVEGRKDDAAYYQQKHDLALATYKRNKARKAASKTTSIADLNHMLTDRNVSREAKRKAALTLAEVHPIWSAFGDRSKTADMLLGRGVPA